MITVLFSITASVVLTILFGEHMQNNVWDGIRSIYDEMDHFIMHQPRRPLK